MKSPSEPCDCKKALAAWNLFSDVAGSVGGVGIDFSNLDGQCQPIYEKVFWGNNLPSMTPEGLRYDPEWTPEETASMTELLTTGLEMFLANTRSWPLE